jgi:putative MFS transporter
MKQKNVVLLVIVASLGYFVDIYDLIIYNIVKEKSLADIGIMGEAFIKNEIYIFNFQMAGMLVGGLLWGILGDKRGRLQVLFGSILLYSIANVANAYVWDIPSYAACRFFAGVGLAGELGAGITLVVETMDKKNRGYGTMVIVTFGALGAVVAFFISNNLGWKQAYIAGGVMGLVLLVLRIGIAESGMYKGLAQSDVKRGDFRMLFNDKARFKKYLACICIGLPVWFVVGVLIALSKRFAAMKVIDGDAIETGKAVLFSYIGLSVGDLLSGILSQVLQSRRKVVLIYLTFISATILYYIITPEMSTGHFYFVCFLLGAATGFWALFVTIASEQFGTNLRSTVTNTVPNFVRGAVVLITLSFTALQARLGANYAGLIVGSVCILLSLISILYVKETFSKDLNYFETE